MPTKKRSQSTPALDKHYTAFIQALDLVSIGLKSCSAELDRASFFALSRKGNKSVQTFKHEYRLAHVEDKFFNSEGQFTMTITDDSKGQPSLNIQCVFQAHIHGETPMNKDFAKRFTDSELRLILVPYARQFITNITGQMSIPPVVIPLATRTIK